MLDAVRWVAVALSLIGILLLGAAAMASVRWPQRFRMIGTGLILMAEAQTQWERLGQPLSNRLPLVLLGCVLLIVGTWMFVFRDDGARPPRRPFQRKDKGVP